MSIVRTSIVDNQTGAALTASGASVTQGQDYTLKTIKRQIRAADVGTAAGQTGYAPGNAPTGAIAFVPVGCTVKAVLSTVVTDGSSAGAIGAYQTLANVFAIVDANGYVRVFDSTNDQSALVTGDIVVITLLTGNS